MRIITLQVNDIHATERKVFHVDSK